MKCEHSSGLRRSSFLTCLVMVALAAGCAADDKTPTHGQPQGGAAGFGNATAGDGSSAGISATAGSGAGSGTAGNTAGTVGMDMLDECPAVSQTAENKLQPADIIIGIDTSGSMGPEIAFVQSEMNAFSKQIIDSGVDAHVILLAKAGEGTAPTMCTDITNPACWAGAFGGNLSVCIDAPLGSGMCPADSKDPNYAHLDTSVGSNDILNVFVNSYAQYKPHLREDSLKTFVAVTDDDATDGPINNAAAFIAAINGLEADPDAPWWKDWNYSGIFCSTMCPDAASIGVVHDQLVTMTGGIKGDLCMQAAGFKAVFDALAKKVVGSVKLACDWEIPPPPDAKMFEAGKTNVKLTIEGTEETLGKAESGAKCGAAGGWYYDNEAKPTKVVACPATCDRMQAAKDASVKVLFGCDTIPVLVD